MVSPTQSVPEVPAVWGNESPPHTIACRRYAIMVGSWIMIFGGVLWWGFVVGFEVVDLSYHNRVSTTHYRYFIIATPHSQYLRH